MRWWEKWRAVGSICICHCYSWEGWLRKLGHIGAYRERLIYLITMHGTLTHTCTLTRRPLFANFLNSTGEYWGGGGVKEMMQMVFSIVWIIIPYVCCAWFCHSKVSLIMLCTWKLCMFDCNGSCDVLIASFTGALKDGVNNYSPVLWNGLHCV